MDGKCQMDAQMAKYRVSGDMLVAHTYTSTISGSGDRLG